MPCISKYAHDVSERFRCCDVEKWFSHFDRYCGKLNQHCDGNNSRLVWRNVSAMLTNTKYFQLSNGYSVDVHSSIYFEQPKWKNCRRSAAHTGYVGHMCACNLLYTHIHEQCALLLCTILDQIWKFLWVFTALNFAPWNFQVFSIKPKSFRIVFQWFDATTTHFHSVRMATFYTL